MKIHKSHICRADSQNLVAFRYLTQCPREILKLTPSMIYIHVPICRYDDPFVQVPGLFPVGPVCCLSCEIRHLEPDAWAGEVGQILLGVRLGSNIDEEKPENDEGAVQSEGNELS